MTMAVVLSLKCPRGLASRAAFTICPQTPSRPISVLIVDLGKREGEERRGDETNGLGCGKRARGAMLKGDLDHLVVREIVPDAIARNHDHKVLRTRRVETDRWREGDPVVAKGTCGAELHALADEKAVLDDRQAGACLPRVLSKRRFVLGLIDTALAHPLCEAGQEERE